MKTNLFLTGALLFGMTITTSAQEVVPPTPPTPPTPPAAPAPAEGEGDDTTKMNFGNVTMLIIEHDKNDKKGSESGGVNVDIEDDEDEMGDFGRWSGLGIGVNGLLTFDNQLTMTPENKYLELDYARSVSVNFNFAEKRFPIIKNYLGITTGMGIQWNRYGFKNNYDIRYNADSLYGVENTAVNYSKNVLKATYLQIPLLIDINTSKIADKSFHISAGVVGGYKLGSRLKTRWEMDGQEYKNKTKGHYQFFPFQAYATAMVGYGDISLYLNYGLTRVFEKGKGPQLYPVTAGILFHI